MQLFQINENSKPKTFNSLTEKSKYSSCLINQLSLSQTNDKTTLKKSPSDVFRINILSSLSKMVSLPKLIVWNRLTVPIVAVQDRLRLQIRTNGLILRRDKGWLNCHCIISGKGYFVIYAKENECQGYAVSLRSAKKVEVLSGKIESTDNKKNLFNLQYYCTVTIKWKFGVVVISLTENQCETWRQIILNAFEGKQLLPLNNLNLSNSNHNGDSIPNIKIEKQVSLNNLKKEQVEVKNSSENDDEASFVESSQTEHTNQTKITIKHVSARPDESQCENDNYQDLIESEKHKREINSEVLSEINGELQNNTNMWSDDDINENITSFKQASFYASLPISFAHKYRSKSALMFNSNNPHYNARYDRKPLLDWLSTVGADNRFRRAKQYFESGAYKYEQKIEEIEEDYNN